MHYYRSLIESIIDNYYRSHFISNDCLIYSVDKKLFEIYYATLKYCYACWYSTRSMFISQSVSSWLFSLYQILSSSVFKGHSTYPWITCYGFPRNYLFSQWSQVYNFKMWILISVNFLLVNKLTLVASRSLSINKQTNNYTDDKF